MQKKAENKRAPSVMRTLTFLWPAVRRYDHRLLWVSAGLIFLGIAVPYTELILPKTAIALLLEGAGVQRIAGQLSGLLLLAVFLHFLNAYCLSKRRWLLSYIGQGSSHELLMKSLTCPYRYSQDADAQALYGRLRSLLDSNATNCYVLALHALTDMAVGAAGFFLYMAILGRIELWLVLLLAAASAVHFLAMRQVSRHGHRLKEQTAGLDKKLEYLFRVTGSLSYAKEVRLYQGSGWLLEKLGKLSGECLVYDRKKEEGRFAGHAICALAAFLRDGIVYAALICMVLEGKLSLDAFVFAAGAVRGLSAFLLRVLDGAVLFNSAGLYMEDLRTYGETDDEAGAQAEGPAEAKPYPAAKDAPQIEFEEVSYTYPGGKQIFDRLSLKIEPGEKLALVGQNGAGKTTFINLLCGLIRADKGRVLLNGRDIGEIPREVLFSYFAPVFQDNFLMPTTLAQNVAPTAPEDEEGIWRCLKECGLAAEAAGWKKGLHTPMTRVAYEEGLELSGGQKQKLYLARMLYQNAPVILLDEPTSALDPLAESEVYRQYNRFTKGRTAIFISHRLASTRFCDRILLLENGAIREQESHEELMEKRGAYYELFSLQSRYYQKEKLSMPGERYAEEY
ncbi:MAG: ABC transporter ATP-binding protein [Lachnospiraceae bacterium]|nr:ABC transporter ATP-binding protein [Lachnospiraceae bacterium]